LRSAAVWVAKGRDQLAQYKVPQNIDLEDKIVGPFTLKQFVYLLIAGAIIYGWWNYLAARYVAGTYTALFLLVALPVGILGAALALVKVNDRPFEVFLLSLVKFIFSPKQRMWKEGFRPEPVIMIDKNEAPKEEKRVKDTGNLDDLAKSLDDQEEELKAKEMTSSKIAKTPVSKSQNPLNVSVTDVQGASQRQAAAQKQPPATKSAETAPATPPKKKGIANFLKGI
jgi:hypothetical protein